MVYKLAKTCYIYVYNLVYLQVPAKDQNDKRKRHVIKRYGITSLKRWQIAEEQFVIKKSRVKCQLKKIKSDVLFQQIPSSYRSITDASSCAEVLQRALDDHDEDFIQLEKLLNREQTGFNKKNLLKTSMKLLLSSIVILVIVFLSVF